MQIDDHIHCRFIGGLAGVQWSVGLYFRVLDILGADSVSKIIGDLGDQFWDEVDDNVSSEVSLSGVIYRNQTMPEQTIVFYSGKNGLQVGQAHPPHQCVRINLYGQVNPGERYKQSSIHLPGSQESVSQDGVRTSGFFQDVANWLAVGGINTSPTGAVLNPVIRWNAGNVATPNWQYVDVEVARVKSQFMVLRRRKRSAFGF